MRRLLPILVVLALLPQSAAAAVQPTRLPAGIRVVDAAVTFPVIPRYAHRTATRRTITSRAKVARLVALVDGLHAVSGNVICPAIAIAGPELTLVFRAGRARPALAEAQVMVTTGSRGHSGSVACFPIRLTVGGRWQTPRVGSTFVRSVGQLIGTSIS